MADSSSSYSESSQSSVALAFPQAICSKQSSNDVQERVIVDRINHLPDHLVTHILSFLPTKAAVATSILSNSWRTLWTMVPVLDFDSSSINTTQSLTDIISRFLSMLKTPFLKKFRLRCLEKFDINHFESWVYDAVERHVEELDICMCNPDLKLELMEPAIVPSNLYTCRSLVVLKLSGKLYLDVPMSVHLPHLKILELIRVGYGSEDSPQSLFSGCPVLEHLWVHRLQDNDSMMRYSINVPSLKSLRAYLYCTGLNVPKLEINTPAVEHLYLSIYNYEVLIMEKFSNLAAAFVDLSMNTELMVVSSTDYCNNRYQLVRKMYNVKSLDITCFTRKCLYDAVFHDLMFSNLVRLRLRGFCCQWPKFINKFLENAHELEELRLDKNSNFCHPEPCRSTKINEQYWIPPLHVPECLSSHLKIFSFLGVKGYKDELKLAKYILENGRVLNKVKIVLNRQDDHLMEQLSMHPKGSRKCKVDIYHFL